MRDGASGASSDRLPAAPTPLAEAATGSTAALERELARARERIAFYEGFDRLIQENIARSGDLLRQAAEQREAALREVEQARAELERRRGEQRATLTGLAEELLGLQRHVGELTGRVMAAIDDLGANGSAAFGSTPRTAPGATLPVPPTVPADVVPPPLRPLDPAPPRRPPASPPPIRLPGPRPQTPTTRPRPPTSSPRTMPRTRSRRPSRTRRRSRRPSPRPGGAPRRPTGIRRHPTRRPHSSASHHRHPRRQRPRRWPPRRRPRRRTSRVPR